jgi:DNA-binding CsgD family transcriptional regulator
VVDLCRRLDGLPLAIELAAVRTRVLTAEQILDRLADRFGLLTRGGIGALPRHQTLRTTIDWSHDLLAAGEQTLLRRLCVFAGRLTLEDVESVCASEDAPAATVLELLSSLVDKSLVVKENAGGRACFRLHETMREYAVLRLREAGEGDAVEARFDDYYVTKCQQSFSGHGAGLLEWLEWMDVEIDNVRSVLQRCLALRDTQRGLDLVGSLGWYWATRATSEGIRWLDALLALESASAPAPAVAHFKRGFLAILQADPTVATLALDRAATAAQELGNNSLRLQALALGSIAANLAGDRPSARRLLDEAHAIATDPDDYPATIVLLQARALGGLLTGDLDAVSSAASEGVRLSREASDLHSLEMMLLNLGYASLVSGDLETSKPLCTESLRIARQIDDRVAQCHLLVALGCHTINSGQPRLGAQLLGAAETAKTGVGAGGMTVTEALLSQAEELAAAAIGAPGFKAEVNAGKRLSRAAAIGLALGEPVHVAAPAPAPVAASPLGKRQAQVAHLVADGLSNKQIGARLFISEHTVDSHVRSILTKLGFNSRAQIAAWIVASNQ